MRRVVSAVATSATALVLAVSAPAFAIPDGAFELDGNVVNGAAPGIDWGTLFPRGSWAGAIAASFVADGAGTPQDASYFTGGGSKDPNNVPDWAFTTGDVAPDKDELTDAFALAYLAPRTTGRTKAGDLIFAFGSDRFANNGDAQIGFWFFRTSVSLGAGGRFTGTHTVGDLLILSDFTQGGRVGTVKVFRWVGSGGSDGSLDLLVAGRDCSDVSDAAACSEVNSVATASPWPYTPKAGTPQAFPAGALLEGAINVSLLEPGVRCFSTFLAETRSSQAIGAQLKDLVLGPFDTCPPLRPAAPRAPVTTTGGPAAGAPDLPATGPSGLGPLIAAGAALVMTGAALRRPRSRRRAGH